MSDYVYYSTMLHCIAYIILRYTPCFVLHSSCPLYRSISLVCLLLYHLCSVILFSAHYFLHPINKSLSLLKCPACIGLVNTLAYMNSVPRCVTTAVPAEICSLSRNTYYLYVVLSLPPISLSLSSQLSTYYLDRRILARI